ncbi:hypothetical protein MFLAVUS_010294 [Mucor flavus]|uniref:Uncharacterized protein n=1 Tax=Mucor flavus TaxID=439312 RepID=A0ABP9ZCD7_9FUNG
MNVPLGSSNLVVKNWSVFGYFLHVEEGAIPNEAVRRASDNVRQEKASKRYRVNIIRVWTGQYLELDMLPEHRQGKHAKRFFISADPDVKEETLRCVEK